MTEKIKVSGGTWDGEEIKLSKKVSIIVDFRMIIGLNQGNVGPNFGPYGDVYLRLEVEPSENYTREGDHIHSECFISLVDVY